MGCTELWLKYRPKSFKAMIGQTEAVTLLQGYLERDRLPHSLLLHGCSGCGKTTLARIVAEKIGCIGSDCEEVACAALESPIAAMRDLRRRMGTKPLLGKARAWILDEVQSFSRTRFAMEALLDVLERAEKTAYQHAYFFLCTTDPGKLLVAIRNRCAKVPVAALSDDEVRTLLARVCGKESMELTEKVIDRIVEICGGSAREALNHLDKLVGVDGEEEQLERLVPESIQKDAFEVVKKLLWEKCTWDDVAKLLREMPDKANHEKLRQAVLTCATREMLKGGTSKFDLRRAAWASLVIDRFRDPWFTCEQAGLAQSCYEVLRIRERG